jgi:uncharacterized protein with PIN domain
VTLKSLKLDGYLSADGILSSDLVISTHRSSFEDCLFCLHLQRQYSATRELEEFLHTYEVDVNNVAEEATSKFLHALQAILNLSIVF